MATIGNNSMNAKLVLLGDMGTGKSSLVLRFVKGQFLEFQESTIGAAFFSQTLAVSDATVKLEIWDTAGQERYHSLAPMYYRGAAAAIIVYDICRMFRNRLRGLRSGCKSYKNKKAQAYAEENGLFFMETSAKAAINQKDYLVLSQFSSQQEWFLQIDLLKDHNLQHAVLRTILQIDVEKREKREKKEEEMVAVEGRTCESASTRFKGTCVRSSNCASICQGEGFPDGKCEGVRRRCMCRKPC
ncbi:hypothetical protein C4D60_Mb04t36530 [Musa balbisiana]|uniref:Knottins-like domain-containing protein n=1 Tax=Musa balbisiana TaxID=52838 RepID=A0A4S8KH82_MUSBA|nr:hypothetical protein C4D60_Mb04t36530 [Musa balbisiana]